MRKFLLAIVTLISFYTCYSQNESRYFKVPVDALDTVGIPEWAHLMYSKDPKVEEVIDAYDKYYRYHAFEKTTHTQNFKFWYRNVEDKISLDGGRIRDHRYAKEKKTTTKTYSTSNAGASDTWRNIGPYTTYKEGGQYQRPTQTNISCIAVAPSDTNILYCAAEAGGVFKSIDEGLSWSPVTENYPIRNGSDIKTHPTNPDTVYLAYNEYLYKTTDGGSTWGIEYTMPGKIQQLYIHRTTPSILYAATEAGLYKSINSGSTWSNILAQKCWDVVPHAVNPNVIYVSISNTTAKRAEIYKSIDNGSTWTLKDSLWYTPAVLAEASDIGCKIGVTPADTNRVYAALIGSSKSGDNGWIGVYYSLNGGDSWVNPDSIDGGPYVSGKDMATNWFYAGYSGGGHQGWYNFDLDVSHIDPDRIWIGTIWACESANRGKNIEYIRGTRSLEMHADIQDIDVVGNKIWYTSDGGINFSTDEMQTVEVRNTGIYASAFWGFAQGWNEDVWTGGRYHN